MKLELYYPVKPFIKYQNFGDSAACTEDNGLPVTKRKVVGKINGTCPVGYIELYPLLGMKGHTGMDMFGGRGYPCYATHDGVVEELQSEAERGLGIGIVSNESYEILGGNYQIKTRYWHLLNMNVVYDQKIKAGDLIGWCDSTGLSSGDHLHFELKPVIKNSVGKYYNAFQNNGYFGAIDPAPFFNQKFAADIHIEKFSFKKNLSFGSRGRDVSELQGVLVEFGLLAEDCITGYFGSKTLAAVIKFQFKFDIYPPHGFFGPITRAKMNSML